jgi:hypothetical protein
MNLKRISGYICWYCGLPLLAIIATWDFLHHNFLLNNIFFYIAFLMCVPHIFFKTEESEKIIIENFLSELREMTSLEFTEAEIKIKKMPVGKGKALLRHAYKIACKERLGLQD